MLYLDACPVQGRHRAELLLEQSKQGDILETFNIICNVMLQYQVVSMAAERGLHSVVTSTCKVMGMKVLHNNKQEGAVPGHEVDGEGAGVAGDGHSDCRAQGYSGPKFCSVETNFAGSCRQFDDPETD